MTNEAPTADPRFPATVRSQAEARKELDFQGFLEYFLPEALAQMRATMSGQGRPQLPRPGEIEGFEILEARSDGDTGRSVIRYSGYGSFVLEQDWRRTEQGWRVTNMARPQDKVVPPRLMQRIKRLPSFLSTTRMSRPPGGGMMRR